MYVDAAIAARSAAWGFLYVRDYGSKLLHLWMLHGAI